jgi:hypothetical protein
MMKRSVILVAFFLAGLDASAASPSKPSFSARRDYFEYGQYVAVADVNGDGIPDLIDSETGYMQVSFGNGNGTFRTGPHTNTIMLAAFAFVAADINGDGKVDLILAGGLNGATAPQGIAVCPWMSSGKALLGIRMQHPWKRNPAIQQRLMPLPRPQRRRAR